MRVKKNPSRILLLFSLFNLFSKYSSLQAFTNSHIAHANKHNLHHRSQARTHVFLNSLSTTRGRRTIWIDTVSLRGGIRILRSDELWSDCNAITKWNSTDHCPCSGILVELQKKKKKNRTTDSIWGKKSNTVFLVWLTRVTEKLFYEYCRILRPISFRFLYSLFIEISVNDNWTFTLSTQLSII